MQSMSSWASDDKRTLLHFSESTLKTFAQHVQSSNSDCEAGGLLLGSVHGAHMLIEQATIQGVRLQFSQPKPLDTHSLQQSGQLSK